MATYGGETGSEERYISLLTDFGFKRIFGTKPNKDLLTSFLNTLFHGEQVVSDVTYLNSEILPKGVEEGTCRGAGICRQQPAPHGHDTEASLRSHGN